MKVNVHYGVQKCQRESCSLQDKPQELGIWQHAQGTSFLQRELRAAPEGESSTKPMEIQLMGVFHLPSLCATDLFCFFNPSSIAAHLYHHSCWKTVNMNNRSDYWHWFVVPLCVKVQMLHSCCSVCTNLPQLLLYSWHGVAWWAAVSLLDLRPVWWFFFLVLSSADLFLTTKESKFETWISKVIKVVMSVKDQLCSVKHKSSEICQKNISTLVYLPLLYLQMLQL